jgi:chemotaxis signal transduction protein
LSDELTPFTTDDGTEADRNERAGEVVELLVFEQGHSLLGVEARAVDSVIPWRTPATLPLSAAVVLGVVQDRGRVVVVRKGTEGADPRRIVICVTEEGLVGIPATTTRAVGTITVHPKLVFDEPIDTSAGVMTVLDPQALAKDMSGGA